MIPLADPVIIPHDGVQHVHHAVILTQGVLLEVYFQEDLLLQPFRHGFVHKDPGGILFIRLIPVVEVIQGMLYGPTDVLFPGRLRQGIPGDRVLDPSELRIGIVSEGGRRPFA